MTTAESFVNAIKSLQDDVDLMRSAKEYFLTELTLNSHRGQDFEYLFFKDFSMVHVKGEEDSTATITCIPKERVDEYLIDHAVTLIKKVMEDVEH